MAQITIIGAGVMGSALAVPLHDNCHKVNLWGTEFDEYIISSLQTKGIHPGLKIPMPVNVKTFKTNELGIAVKDSDIIIMAVSSRALKEVFTKVVKFITRDQIVITLSKGLEIDNTGHITILSDILKDILPSALTDIPIVTVGGPQKAAEVALRAPTAVVFACRDLKIAKFCRKVFHNSKYMVEISPDVIGVEICAALKNIYAIGIGIYEGYEHSRGIPHKSAKGAIFNYAVLEMADIVQAMGGCRETAFGLAGIGDLELTGEQGRNRTLGKDIGSGTPTDIAIRQVLSQGVTVEGYFTSRFSKILVQQLSEESQLDPSRVPILMAIYKILYEGADVYETMHAALELATMRQS